MRKFILIAAMVLASASAQADSGRSLTLASNDEPAAAGQAKASDNSVEQQPAETPKFVERPAAVEPAAEAPKVEGTKPVAEKTAAAPRTEKPRRRRESTEARVIYELRRHGIYW